MAKRTIKEISLQKLYRDYVQEGHVTTDFPMALSTVIQVSLNNWFTTSENTSFDRWMLESDVSTFREEEKISLTNVGLLTRRKERSAAEETSLSELKYKVKAETFSKKITITREMIVNDSLGAFSNLVGNFVNAAEATQAYEATQLLINPGDGYDGFPYFQTVGDRVNFSTYAEATPGKWKASLQAATALKDAYVQMQLHRDPYRPERYVGRQPSVLVCAPIFEPNLRVLLNSEKVVEGNNNVEVPNPFYGLMSSTQIVPELRLTDSPNPEDVYLFADPTVLPAFEMCYLQGIRQPVVSLKETSLRAVYGTPNPDQFDYPFNDLVYEVLYDFGVNKAEPRGVWKIRCTS